MSYSYIPGSKNGQPGKAFCQLIKAIFWSIVIGFAILFCKIFFGRDN